MTLPIIVSSSQTGPLLAARQKGQTSVEVSLDLGLSMVTATIMSEGVEFPNGECLTWEQAEKVNKSPSNCFFLEYGAIQAIQVFSEETNRLCSLFPTRGAPSMLIAGFVMHRFKDVDPMQDTLKKICSIQPITGRVLDTATGLGYTAIEAAKTAEEVITIELDLGAQEIARCNPWSQALFESRNIRQILGDAFDVVPTFEENYFSRIIHDPPAFSLAGDLYSGEFYRHLYRVLKRGGRLFHYIGDLNSKSGSTVTRGALRRLQEAGFTRIVRRPEAFGVVCYK